MYIGITQKVSALLKDNPGLNAAEIAAAISSKPNTTKVMLNRLVKKNLLVRNKAPRTVKTSHGPQNLYVYSLPQVDSTNADTQN